MNSFEAGIPEHQWNKTGIIKTIGWSFIAMFFLGIFAEFIVRTRLINWENPTLTFTTIQHSLALFDAGILSFIIIIVLDVLLTICFYILFNAASKTTALLMAGTRLVYVAVKGFALVGLLLARDIYSSSVKTTAGRIDTSANEAMQFLKMHHYGFGVGLIFFGLHLICLAILLRKVNGIPKPWGWVLLMAGIGYGINSLVSLFAGNFEFLKIVVITIFIIPMTFSELSFGIWLWIKHKTILPVVRK